MIIGYHSPMPPARTGVAAYSAALVRALRAAGAVVRVNPAERCEQELFHIGNNPLHAPAHERALTGEGAVVLHDAVLHHFYLGWLDQARYVEEFVYNYGEWSRSMAEELWRERGRSAQEECCFRYPMLRRVVERARLVIVHNRAAAESARAHGARRVVEIPHLAAEAPPVVEMEVEQLRRSWGAGAGTVVFGVFGHLRESKRIHTIVKSFRRLARVRDARLLVAGEAVSAAFGRALEAWLDGGAIIRRAYLAEVDFWRHAAATDVCINLRYPAAGETSGIMIRMMSLGKPVVVTGGAEVSGFPAGTLIPIDAGLAEEESLLAAMMLMTDDRRGARRIGLAAQRHIREAHAPAVVARRLLAALVDYN